MNLPPLIPENAPFTSEQRAWLNGFLASALFPVTQSTPNTVSQGPNLLILYGSQSGNAESLAKKTSKQARAIGLQARAVSMEGFAATTLLQEQNLLLITSTWGEGEMPDNAKHFWEDLSAADSLKLSQLNYAVIALGDIKYTDTFCLAGKLFDEKLRHLGAQHLQDRIDCDVDFERTLAPWLDSALKKFKDIEPSTLPVSTSGNSTQSPTSTKKYTEVVLLTNRKLNNPGSLKDVRHIEFSLEGTQLTYEAGDALGVFPKNCPDFVQEIIQAAGLTGHEVVTLEEEGNVPLHIVLTEKVELRPLLTRLPEKGITPQQLVDSLKKLQPRLYSISSSPKAHAQQVRLTVGTVRFDHEGRARKGACSTYLADRLPLGDHAHVFVQKSHGFRLPENRDTSIIMVGPGTGIAPFRAFIYGRVATHAAGKNWLFFGEQKSSTDFLYREELENLFSDGKLHRLSTAFSRDQEKKIYVQDRMLEHGNDLWEWIREGAHLYVCGDASRMAKDVDAALHAVLETHGQISPSEAKAYVQQMKKDKRYQRDIY